MIATNEHFITQMKLRELREQRARLSETYAALQQKAAEQPTELKRLDTLYTGLQKIKLTNNRLHPEIANLEPLLQETEPDKTSLETLTFWLSRLEKELATGLLRAEIVYTFGALLEEWAAQTGNLPSNTQQEESALLHQITQTSDVQPNITMLNELLESRGYTHEEAIKYLQEEIQNEIYKSISSEELSKILKRISSDPCRTADTRAQAHSFLRDNIARKEFAEALTIMLEHLDEWNWPQEGIPIQAAYTTKWRLFINDDLPTACFLELLGTRWFSILQQFYSRAQHDQYKRLLQILDQASTEDIGPLAALNKVGEFDIWNKLTPQDPNEHSQNSIPGWVEYEKVDYYAIFRTRFMQREELINATSFYGGYDSQPSDEVSGTEKALMLINAELELARVSFPDTPLYILKADVKDFYPTLSHTLILTLLERIGLPETQLAFIRKFLHMPLQQDGKIIYAQSGIPTFHRLSDAFGELVLDLLDHYILKAARVQIVRIVDDICIITPSADEAERAWNALQEFCSISGLALNQEKCGAVCIGSNLPASLPSQQPAWSLIALDQTGQWDVNWQAFEDYLKQIQQQVQQERSLIAQVDLYNHNLSCLVTKLALHAPLGTHHRTSVYSALHRYHQEFFGTSGFVEALRASIEERFFEAGKSPHLPEAWLYWPITAGGVGIRNAVITALMYAESLAKRSEVTRPEELKSNWQRSYGDWNRFYNSHLSSLSEKAPEPNQIMETLVKDFIQRGEGLSDGEQKGLSPYWRWVLYIYGPQILEHLGTFRFLISELVPLQLTTRKYRQSGEEGETD